MARQREVGTLWIGGALSWMEQLCLKSFVDQGQKITLFAYEDIPNVPDGVHLRDGREVLDTDDFIKYERKDSFALFADYFRIHMIQQNPGMIWVDTDVYCHRPMDYDSDYVMGFELPGEKRVNNAVLGLPADSPVVSDMLAFMSDRYAIPGFLKKSQQEEFARAAAAGSPVHVSQQPWGVWGPMMVSHFVHKRRLKDQVQPLEAFYPIPFPDRLKFLRRTAVVESFLTPQTTALHLWASNKRELGLRHGGIPPDNSYLADLLRKHDIRPEDAPIKSRGRHVFDAGLLGGVDLARVSRFGDICGNAQSLALAAWGKWGCDIDLIDLDHKGRWPQAPSSWVAPYRQFLLDHDVPANRIRVVSDDAAYRPAEVLANLSGFGDVNKVSLLEPVLTACLAPGGILFSDIRKGSGGYPFLKPYGEVTQLNSRNDGGAEIHRVLLRAPGGAAVVVPPSPRTARVIRVDGKPVVTKPAEPAEAPAETGTEEAWSVIADRLAENGGFTRENPNHSFLYIPRGDTLVVTFDNLDIAMTKREDRRPWGFSFIEKQGWSMLGVMANGWTWYRDQWVCDQFDELQQSGFFRQFRRVVFYGASMGGYAACAFVAACPGADVFAISPQSTLDKTLVPFETRYKSAWDRDYSGKYGDAALASQAAGRVTLLYDPYEPLDTGHVDRFTGSNVVKLRAPLLGHRLGSSLQQMGILAPITLGALHGTLTELEFYQTLKARKSFSRYQKELFKRAMKNGHPLLARRMGRYVLTRGDNRFIRKELAAL